MYLSLCYVTSFIAHSHYKTKQDTIARVVVSPSLHNACLVSHDVVFVERALSAERSRNEYAITLMPKVGATFSSLILQNYSM